MARARDPGSSACLPAGRFNPDSRHHKKDPMRDKTLAAAAYIFWVPSLYIVLTEKRKDPFVGFHGGQALLLWTFIFGIFFLLRFLVNLLWSFIYVPYLDLIEVLGAITMGIYAVYCGWRCFQGQDFKIPH